MAARLCGDEQHEGEASRQQGALRLRYNDGKTFRSAVRVDRLADDDTAVVRDVNCRGKLPARQRAAQTVRVDKHFLEAVHAAADCPEKRLAADVACALANEDGAIRVGRVGDTVVCAAWEIAEPGHANSLCPAECLGAEGDAGVTDNDPAVGRDIQSAALSQAARQMTEPDDAGGFGPAIGLHGKVIAGSPYDDRAVR